MNWICRGSMASLCCLAVARLVRRRGSAADHRIRGLVPAPTAARHRTSRSLWGLPLAGLPDAGLAVFGQDPGRVPGERRGSGRKSQLAESGCCPAGRCRGRSCGPVLTARPARPALAGSSASPGIWSAQMSERPRTARVRRPRGTSLARQFSYFAQAFLSGERCIQ